MSHWSGGYSASDFGMRGMVYSQQWKNVKKEWESKWLPLVESRIGTQLEEAGKGFFRPKGMGTGFPCYLEHEDENLSEEEIVERLILDLQSNMRKHHIWQEANKMLAAAGYRPSADSLPLTEDTAQSLFLKAAQKQDDYRKVISLLRAKRPIPKHLKEVQRKIEQWDCIERFEKEYL